MQTSAEPQTPSLSSPQEVLDLLREQAALYEQLEALARRQRVLITDDEPEPLLTLLAQRQELTARITRQARELEPVRSCWERYRSRMTPAQQEQADRLVEDLQERLDKLMASDERDAKLLMARKESASKALRHTCSSRQALAAYQVPMTGSGRFNRMDQES